jgi:hypothetical protein
MAQEKIYPNGLMIFQPREGAPDFVKGSMVMSLKKFTEWAKTMSEHYTEYQGEKQLRFDILEGDKGLYTQLNTWKPDAKKEQVEETSDLPF